MNRQRKEAKEKLRRIQEEATAVMSRLMSRLSKQLYTKHEKASNQLSERASQVELLHDQLSKLVERTNIDKGSMKDLTKELDRYKAEVENHKSEI